MQNAVSHLPCHVSECAMSVSQSVVCFKIMLLCVSKFEEVKRLSSRSHHGSESLMITAGGVAMSQMTHGRVAGRPVAIGPVTTGPPVVVVATGTEATTTTTTSD